MKTYTICPISTKKIDEHVARFNGLFTVLFLLAFLLSNNALYIVVLAIDFLLRSTGNSRYSYICIASQYLVSRFRLTKRIINAGPKIFAVRIGFVFASAIVLSLLSGAGMLAYSLVGVLGLFSFLEAAFGFCVACEIYPFLYKFAYRRAVDVGE